MILPFVDYVARKNKNNLILYSDVKSIPGSTYHQDFLRTQTICLMRNILEDSKVFLAFMI